jgi:nucleoid-associated protein YgaU
MPESFAAPLRDPEQSPIEGASAATRETTARAPHVVNKEPVPAPEDSDGDGDSRAAKQTDAAQATRQAGDKKSPAIVRLPKVEDTPSIVRHRVVDGDSLEALAERYLGAAQRADEIYQANRERLASPELLPIGVELSISRSSSATVASEKAARPEGSAAAPVSPATALVPLTAEEIARLRRERN